MHDSVWMQKYLCCGENDKIKKFNSVLEYFGLT